MKHSFTPSILNSELCGTCKRDKIAHTKEAVCEACSNVGPVELMYGNMLLCESCISKDKEHQSPEKQEERVNNYRNSVDAFVQATRSIDDSLRIRTDVFNAKTAAIVEIKNAIYNDPAIENKPYAFASECTRRFEILKKVIFDKNQEIIDATNEQKALQVQLNQMANQLRAEEREKLKIADINYKPPVVKSVTPAKIKTASKKLDKVELRKVL
jgi:hypothetical protein